MAASMKRHGTENDSTEINSECSVSIINDNETTKGSCLSSKQLLYSEKFPDCATDKLKIVQHSGRGKLKTDLQEHKTYRLPQSSVLSQVKGFLPQLELSNADLQRRLADGTTSDLDIENVESCNGPVIEMNLALVEMATDVTDESAESSCSSDDSDSDSDYDRDVQMGKVTENNIKLTQMNDKKPKGSIIEVLKSGETDGPGEITLTDSSLMDSDKCNGVT